MTNEKIPRKWVTVAPFGENGVCVLEVCDSRDVEKLEAEIERLRCCENCSINHRCNVETKGWPGFDVCYKWESGK